MADIRLTRQIQGLMTTLAFGNGALWLFARYLFRWPEADALRLVVLFTGLALFVMALSGFALLAPGLAALSEVVGGGLGTFAGALLYEFERRDVAARKVVVAPAVEVVPPTMEEIKPIVPIDRLTETLGIFVKRACVGGKYSREALVGENLMTQPEWNLANAVLKIAGLRDGTRYTGKGGVTQDMDWLRQCVRVTEDAVWVHMGRGQWSKVDLAACNL